MQEWEEKIIEKRKAREEGLAVGRAEGRIEGRAEGRVEGRDNHLWEQVQKKLAKGCSPETIADALEEDISIIKDIIQKLTA